MNTYTCPRTTHHSNFVLYSTLAHKYSYCSVCILYHQKMFFCAVSIFEFEFSSISRSRSPHSKFSLLTDKTKCGRGFGCCFSSRGQYTQLYIFYIKIYYLFRFAFFTLLLFMLTEKKTFFFKFSVVHVLRTVNSSRFSDIVE